jgi:hypothetical protein
MTLEQISVVNGWFDRAKVTWIVCDSKEAADDLERSLRSAWLPSLNLT